VFTRSVNSFAGTPAPFLSPSQPGSVMALITGSSRVNVGEGVIGAGAMGKSFSGGLIAHKVPAATEAGTARKRLVLESIKDA
jgi:hypothetical protein